MIEKLDWGKLAGMSLFEGNKAVFAKINELIDVHNHRIVSRAARKLMKETHAKTVSKTRTKN